MANLLNKTGRYMLFNSTNVKKAWRNIVQIEYIY